MMAFSFHHMRPLTVYPDHMVGVISHDGRTMCTIHETMRHWLVLHDLTSNVQRGLKDKSDDEYPLSLDSVCFSTCDRFVFVMVGHTIEQWCVSTRKQENKWELPPAPPHFEPRSLTCSETHVGFTVEQWENLEHVRAQVLDIASGVLHPLVGPDLDDDVYKIVFQPRGNHIATAHGDGFELWCATTFERLRVFEISGNTFALSYSPCGTRLAMAGRYDFDPHCGAGGQVQLWAAGDTVESYVHVDDLFSSDKTACLISVAFSPWSDFVLACDFESRYYEWELDPRRLVCEEHVDIGIESCAYDTRGEKVVFGGPHDTAVAKLAFCGKQRRQFVSRHNYSLRLLHKQRWWPEDITKFLRTFLICEY